MAKKVFEDINLMKPSPSIKDITKNETVHQDVATNLPSVVVYPKTLTLNSSSIYDASSKGRQPDSTSFVNSKTILSTISHSTALTTSAFHNATTPIPVTKAASRGNNLLLYIGVPAAVVGFFVLGCLLVSVLLLNIY